jgi:prephenate dehydrogenase
MNFGTVAILGPGLIGGSLALALAERGLAKRLKIYARSARALDEIRAAGVDAELTGNPSEAVRDADVVILCVPIEAMAGLVREIRDALKPTALVTDVGSVKGSVDHDLAPLLEGRARWIGSHPMAGSEQAGFSSARADLFEGAAVIVAPTDKTSPEAQRLAEKFWKALGGRLFSFDPESHDIAVAEISHVPHLVAALLAGKVNQEALALAGGGFRDTTRIASGSPELWTEILWANRQAMKTHCAAWISLMGNLKGIFESDDPTRKSELFKILKDAQSVRSRLFKKDSASSKHK